MSGDKIPDLDSSGKFVTPVSGNKVSMNVRDLVKHLVTHYKLEDTVLLHIETEEQHLYTEATNVWRIDNNTIAIVSKKENKE